MKDNFTKAREGDLTKPFNAASGTVHPHVKELVRHLARITAARDFEKLQKKSNSSYNLPPTKGKKT
jgi:hypothetical protein